MISEIRISTVGVRDLDASVAFYRSVFDYVEKGRGETTAAETVHLWGGAADMKGRQVVLGPEGVESGLLRLVQYEAPADLYWGDYSALEDYGHYALNIRVPHLNDSLRTLAEHGGRTRSGPAYWTVSPDLSAWDSLNYDPDGILLDVFQLETEPTSALHDYDGRPSALQTVATHCSDAQRSARFYAAIGLRPMYDKVLESMEDFFTFRPGQGFTTST